MDLTEPEGCWSAGVGWAGQPLDTAHLRLFRLSGTEIGIEDRLGKTAIGRFQIAVRGSESAELRAFFTEAAAERDFAAESLRRCLRMLFDNYGVALVKAENLAENQLFSPVFESLGFDA